MGKHRKWFCTSCLYGNKRDILLNGMILSGTYSIKQVLSESILCHSSVV